MSGKKHNIGRHISLIERAGLAIPEDYRSSETLCGLLFKRSDRNPFADTEDDITCQWCQKIMNKKEADIFIR